MVRYISLYSDDEPKSLFQATVEALGRDEGCEVDRLRDVSTGALLGAGGHPREGKVFERDEARSLIRRVEEAGGNFDEALFAEPLSE